MEKSRELRKQLTKGVLTLGDEGAKLVADTYYYIQKGRIAAEAKGRILKDIIGSSEFYDAVAAELGALEQSLQSAMGRYVASYPWGQWALSVPGIGPVTATMLCAYVDPVRFPNPSKVWRAAGLDPSATDYKYSRRMKAMAYYIGEAFVRASNSPYRELFNIRKRKEWGKNLSGQNAERALEIASRWKDKNAPSYLWLSGQVDLDYAKEVAAGLHQGETKPKVNPDNSVPMLPPAHIHARARRWIAKLFIAHFWEVRYYYLFNEVPPKPYAVQHQGHTDYIPPWKAPWLTNPEGVWPWVEIVPVLSGRSSKSLAAGV